MVSRWQERSWHIGLGLLAVIVILALLWTIPKVEQDLEAQTELALQEIDRDDLRVRIHGRDATIVGPADARAVEESAIRLVSNVRGVTSVNTEFVDPTAIAVVPVVTTINPLGSNPDTPDTPDTANGEPATAADAGANSSTTQARTTTSRATAGSRTTSSPNEPDTSGKTTATARSRSTTTAVASPAFPPPALRVPVLRVPVLRVPVLRVPVLRVMAEISEQSVVLTGTVATVEERRILVETVGLRDKGPRVVDGLQVPENIPAGAKTEEMTSFAVLINRLAEEVIRGSAHLSGGEIALSGVVPNPRSRARLEESIATMRTGGINVTGRFGVNQEPRAGEDPTLSPKAAAAKADIDEILSNGAIEFTSGGSSLVSEPSPVLDDIAETLKRHPELLVQIGGHTDNVGDPDKNRELSQQRASTVRNYLVEQSIDPFLLTAIGYGDQIPVADNDSESGRRRNRRVEFTITEVS